jgi:hypothetical protein
VSASAQTSLVKALLNDRNRCVKDSYISDI